MPFTPLHFGPGLALMAVTGNNFSATLFCFVQMLIDLEPGVQILRGAEPIHGFLHTYAGATLAALVVLGVFLGSASWWVVLAAGADWLRGRIGPPLFRAINIVSGLSTLGLALWQLVAVLR